MDNMERRQRMAWDIYRDYIVVGAKNELNLDSMSRKVTTLGMITPHLTTFDTARARVHNLLSNDGYMRFLQWSIYRDLVNSTTATSALEAESNNSGAATAPTPDPAEAKETDALTKPRVTSVTSTVSTVNTTKPVRRSNASSSAAASASGSGNRRTSAVATKQQQNRNLSPPDGGSDSRPRSRPRARPRNARGSASSPTAEEFGIPMQELG